MPITVYCKQCGKQMNAPESGAGRKGKCSACGAVVEIPLDSETAPPLLPVGDVKAHTTPAPLPSVPSAAPPNAPIAAPPAKASKLPLVVAGVAVVGLAVIVGIFIGKGGSSGEKQGTRPSGTDSSGKRVNGEDATAAKARAEAAKARAATKTGDLPTTNTTTAPLSVSKPNAGIGRSKEQLLNKLADVLPREEEIRAADNKDNVDILMRGDAGGKTIICILGDPQNPTEVVFRRSSFDNSDGELQLNLVTLARFFKNVFGEDYAAERSGEFVTKRLRDIQGIERTYQECGKTVRMKFITEERALVVHVTGPAVSVDQTVVQTPEDAATKQVAPPSKYAQMSVKQLAEHINENLIGGQGVQQETVWKDIYWKIIYDNEQTVARMMMENTGIHQLNSPMFGGSVCTKGECQAALEALYVKMGGHIPTEAEKRAEAEAKAKKRVKDEARRKTEEEAALLAEIKAALSALLDARKKYLIVVEERLTEINRGFVDIEKRAKDNLVDAKRFKDRRENHYQWVEALYESPERDAAAAVAKIGDRVRGLNQRLVAAGGTEQPLPDEDSQLEKRIVEQNAKFRAIGATCGKTAKLQSQTKAPKGATEVRAVAAGDISLVNGLKEGTQLTVTMKKGNTVDCEFTTTKDTYLLILKYQGKNLQCFLKEVQEIQADGKTIYTARADGVMTTGPASAQPPVGTGGKPTAKALLNLATQYLKTRDLEKAKEYAKKVKDQFPGSKEAEEAEIILQQK